MLTAVVARGRVRVSVAAALLLGLSWSLLWSGPSFWSPLFFVGTWLGATVLMYTASGQGYPGWRRHALLALIAIPVWWWFELANTRVGNWEYILSYDYDRIQYMVMASLAFSTVVPALDSAWSLTLSRFAPPSANISPGHRGGFVTEIAIGLGTLALVFAFPGLFFPLVWVAPFLVTDGLVGYRGGHSLVWDLGRGEWRLAAAVGLAGIWCGLLWEFWNYWAAPKWVYHIPYLDLLKVFEMPVLGYLGYVPFVWAIYQLLHLIPLPRACQR